MGITKAIADLAKAIHRLAYAVETHAIASSAHTQRADIASARIGPKPGVRPPRIPVRY